MNAILKELIKQPYWIVALILGAFLVTFPSITIDKDHNWIAHPPVTFWPLAIGLLLIIFSTIAFGLAHLGTTKLTLGDAGAGVDLSRVKEDGDILSTYISGCELCVTYGRIEDHIPSDGSAVILPCNEYFDDHCVGDTRSALGAFVNRTFDGQASAFTSLVQKECLKRFGEGTKEQKTNAEHAISFGPGRCLLFLRPLNRSISVALVATTTQRAGEGLAARISYLFEGMRQLVSSLADARIDSAVMPLLGAGRGGIDPPLAFVGLLLAVAEAARYGQGGQRLRRVTIVVYKRDAEDPGQVNRVVVRRALALIGTHA